MKANRSQSVKSPDDEIQGIILSENRPVFKDVKGMFSIAPPRGWGISTYPNSSPYNVTFQSPNGPSISVTATKVEYNSLATLLDRVEGIQDNLGLNMNIEEIKFTDVPAIRRTTVLHHAKVITIDFVDNYIGHNIQISIPHSLYERFSPVLLDVVSSYKPLK